LGGVALFCSDRSAVSLIPFFQSLLGLSDYDLFPVTINDLFPVTINFLISAPTMSVIPCWKSHKSVGRCRPLRVLLLLF
jgi:hypothetical protein